MHIRTLCVGKSGIVLLQLRLRAGFNRNRYLVITGADYSYLGKWPVSMVNGYGLGSCDGGYDRRLIGFFCRLVLV